MSRCWAKIISVLEKGTYFTMLFHCGLAVNSPTMTSSCYLSSICDYNQDRALLTLRVTLEGFAKNYPHNFFLYKSRVYLERKLYLKSMVLVLLAPQHESGCSFLIDLKKRRSFSIRPYFLCALPHIFIGVQILMIRFLN